MKIKVKFVVKSWDGLAGKIFPEQETELILSKGQRLVDKDFGGFQGSGFIIALPKIEVADITETGFSIITDGLNESGKVDLMKPSHGVVYSILFGKTLALTTQTMDTGMKFSITPLEIIKE